MSAGGKFGRTIWRGLRGTFRLVVRHPAAVLSTILGVVALVLGYRVWRVGWRTGLTSLLGLVVCLLLIVIILLTRSRIRQWTQRSSSEGKSALQKRVAKQAVREGVGMAEDLLEKGTEKAKGALDSLADEVKSDWESVVGPPAAAQPTQQAGRCPSCGSFVRSGARFCESCGEPLPLSCARCHRTSRPGARFCEHCGAPLGG
jgi:hypothetical protein